MSEFLLRSEPLKSDASPQQAMHSALELIRGAVLCTESEASEACALVGEARRRLEHAEMILCCGGKAEAGAQEGFLEF